ncbi:carcinoembryonic antigen-related cell adhesion molecule 1-like [Pseudorasbora parva]|uniref:carcinoembryonic antigen-related cell adhesion molecule 1-like n=1 Tax=Pseudorasbora parva TaxID=51549 RepID=UPI00351DF36C
MGKASRENIFYPHVFLWAILLNCSSLLYVSDVNTDKVSVIEGDSVTLHTGVQTNQQDRIRWYYKDIRIAQINRDQSKVCTDVQCNEGTERFRDRLKLDHQTGSLTIINITNTDAGDYQLKIIHRDNSDSGKTFTVAYGVSAADRDEVKRKSVKEGKSVTLDPGVMKNTNDSMMWYFTDVLIAEITGDQSQICTDDQCEERFRDRLKLDHQTGALTITHTTTEDSGEYTLQINSSRFSIIRSISVSVTAVPVSSGAVAGICAAVVVLLVAAAAAAAVIYYRQLKAKKRKVEQKGKY